jgi:membrane protein required for beta-lactamase induction
VRRLCATGRCDKLSQYQVISIRRAISDQSAHESDERMLETIIVILVILWLLGWLVVPVAGGLIHLLLVLILIVILVRLLTGRRPLP